MAGRHRRWKMLAGSGVGPIIGGAGRFGWRDEARMPEMTQVRVRAAGPVWGQWAMVVGLSMVVGALAMQLLSAPAADASAAAAGAAGRGKVFAIAGQVSPDSYGLYLVDLEQSTICVYEYVARDHKLWLRAARTFKADMQLDSYNTMPRPKDVKEMVAEARRLKDIADKEKP